MELKFTFEELEIQKAVRKFAARDLLPESKEMEEKGELSSTVRDKFLSMGLLKSVFPQTYGGA